MTFDMTTEELSSLVKKDKNLPQRLLNYTTYVQEFGLLNFFSNKIYENEPNQFLKSIYFHFENLKSEEKEVVLYTLNELTKIPKVLLQGIKASLYMTDKMYTAVHLKNTYDKMNYQTSKKETSKFLKSAPSTSFKKILENENKIIEELKLKYA